MYKNVTVLYLQATASTVQHLFPVKFFEALKYVLDNVIRISKAPDIWGPDNQGLYWT